MLYDLLSEMEGKWLLTNDYCQEARDRIRVLDEVTSPRQKGIDGEHGDMEYRKGSIATYGPLKYHTLG